MCLSILFSTISEIMCSYSYYLFWTLPECFLCNYTAAEDSHSDADLCVSLSYSQLFLKLCVLTVITSSGHCLSVSFAIIRLQRTPIQMLIFLKVVDNSGG